MKNKTMGNVSVEREYKYKGEILYTKCTICGEWKSVDNYPIDSSKKFGTRSDCKDCHKLKNKINHRKWYDNNREYSNDKCREYHKRNRDKINKVHEEYEKKSSEEKGFNRHLFHSRTRYYVKKHNLKPKYCTICGREGKLEMHHPSYDSESNWSSVVFCCRYCHKGIHTGNIECPQPINLLESIQP